MLVNDNILLNSHAHIKNNNYLIHDYMMAEKPKAGDVWTLTLYIKEHLKKPLSIYNSGGMVFWGNLKEIGENCYSLTASWKNQTPSWTANDSFIRVHQNNPYDPYQLCDIIWAKLERGDKITPWCPNKKEIKVENKPFIIGGGYREILSI